MYLDELSPPRQVDELAAVGVVLRKFEFEPRPRGHREAGTVVTLEVR
jgi:hypothetical protein